MKLAIPSGAELHETVVIGRTLYAVSTKSIHSVRLADSIDPERRNKNIPHVQQLVLKYGSDDEFVGRTFLTAVALFQRGMVKDNFDKDSALSIVLDVVKLLAEMHDFQVDYTKYVRDIAGNFNRDITQGSLELPHYERLNERIKTYLSKVGDVGQRLFDLYSHFYERPKDMWSGARGAVEELYGSGDPFAQFMANAEQFLRFIRNMRNCIQHEKSNQRIIVADFELKSDGHVYAPTIEIVHPETPEPGINLEIFMNQVRQSIITVCEHMIVFLSEKRAIDFGELEFHVVELPKERWHRHVRFQFYPFKKNGELLDAPK